MKNLLIFHVFGTKKRRRFKSRSSCIDQYVTININIRVYRYSYPYLICIFPPEYTTLRGNTTNDVLYKFISTDVYRNRMTMPDVTISTLKSSYIHTKFNISKFVFTNIISYVQFLLDRCHPVVLPKNFAKCSGRTSAISMLRRSTKNRILARTRAVHFSAGEPQKKKKKTFTGIEIM